MTTGSSSNGDSKSTPPSPLRFLVVLVGLVLLVALGAYAWMKYALPGASQTPPTAGHAALATGSAAAAPIGVSVAPTDPHSGDMDQINAMAEKLAVEMKDRPQDSEGWAMLARTYGVLGRQSEAIAAYENAIALRGDDNVLRADYAAARTAAGLPPDSRGVAVAVPVTKTAASSMPASISRTVSGTVSLASALMKQAAPDDAVFIFARPSEGSRMPLALLRKQVKDLPVHFTLDDSMGMSPASRLSQAGPVVVGARVSKSGNAIPEKGDLAGQSAPVAVGAKDLTIEIKDVVMQ
jgi:cytochrome c-type biogenesis protein CcmH